MKTFLSAVAQDLVARSLDLSRTAVIFPNKRAGVFFDRELSNLLQRAFWSPRYLSISEFWESQSDRELADPLLFNYLLFEAYKKHVESDETFDAFFFWGEILGRDFDDLDKHLVDPQQLFLNLRRLREIDDPMDYLTAEQKEVLSSFFAHFDPEKSSLLKEKFLQIWSVLHPIYDDVRARLDEKNKAYEGQMIRRITEKMDKNELPPLDYDHYIFVGFNVLNHCEEKLFSWMKEQGRALFYWDYDESYLSIPQHEAAVFLRRNLQVFGNDFLQLPADFFHQYAASQAPKTIDFIAAPNESSQARYLSTWFKEHPQFQDQPTETAVVLCNEKLLLPVVHALPEIEHANVTMGYPVQQTSIADFVRSWVLYQNHGMPYLATVERVDNWFEHLLPSLEAEILRWKSSSPKVDDFSRDLALEAGFRIYSQILQLQNLIRENLLSLSPSCLEQLILKILQSLRVPFLGEPVLGTQIMGVLETRNLDFRHLILLSVNEGMLPQASNESSFIPYPFRKSFGMTTVEHRNAVYAYYFFRLLQRAEDITLLYNETTDGLNKGEMSRFMLQMMFENRSPIQHRRLQAGELQLLQKKELCIHDPSVPQRIRKRYGANTEGKAFISPSLINSFLSCRLKFYLSKIAYLQPPRVKGSEIDALMMGRLFHSCAENLYLAIAQENSINIEDLRASKASIPVSPQQLNAYLINEERRLQLIRKAFAKEYYEGSVAEEKIELQGALLITQKILDDYLLRILRLDETCSHLEILGLEHNILEEVEFPLEDTPFRVRIGGIIDRLDRTDQGVRIIDYKTGSDKNPLSWDDLFANDARKQNNNLQTLIYGYLYRMKHPKSAIEAHLLHVNKAFSKQHSSLVFRDEGGMLEKDFLPPFQAFLQDLFSCTDFPATPHKTSCRYCDYRGICGEE